MAENHSTFDLLDECDQRLRTAMHVANLISACNGAEAEVYIETYEVAAGFVTREVDEVREKIRSLMGSINSNTTDAEACHD